MLIEKVRSLSFPGLWYDNKWAITRGRAIQPNQAENWSGWKQTRHIGRVRQGGIWSESSAHVACPILHIGPVIPQKQKKHVRDIHTIPSTWDIKKNGSYSVCSVPCSWVTSLKPEKCRAVIGCTCMITRYGSITDASLGIPGDAVAKK